MKQINMLDILLVTITSSYLRKLIVCVHSLSVAFAKSSLFSTYLEVLVANCIFQYHTKSPKDQKGQTDAWHTAFEVLWAPDIRSRERSPSFSREGPFLTLPWSLKDSSMYVTVIWVAGNSKGSFLYAVVCWSCLLPAGWQEWIVKLSGV